MKELTKYGKFMYNLCDKTGFWFVKHKIIYWILKRNVFLFKM